MRQSSGALLVAGVGRAEEDGTPLAFSPCHSGASKVVCAVLCAPRARRDISLVPTLCVRSQQALAKLASVSLLFDLGLLVFGKFLFPLGGWTARFLLELHEKLKRILETGFAMEAVGGTPTIATQTVALPYSRSRYGEPDS